MRTDFLGWLRLQWDRAAAWVCVLAGVITAFVGWLGVSGTSFTAKQLPYLAGCGVGGLILVGVGAMLWLSADLRDEWRKLNRIENAIRECGTAALPQGVAPDPEQVAPTATAGRRAPTHADVRPSVVAGRS